MGRRWLIRLVAAGAAVIAASAMAPAEADAQPRATPAATAQPTSPADVARARELYETGLGMIDDGRWADALGIFRESYQLSRARPALFNVALVLRALGRFREARDTLGQLAAETPPDDPLASIVSVIRAETASRIGALILGGLPARGGARLRFDGAPVDDTGARPLVLESDPGTHALAVSAAGYETFEWRGEIDDGERRQLTVDLEEVSSPLWPWIAAGGALITAVTVVVIVLVAGQSSDSVLGLPQDPD